MTQLAEALIGNYDKYIHMKMNTSHDIMLYLLIAYFDCDE